MGHFFFILNIILVDWFIYLDTDDIHHGSCQVKGN